MLFTETTNIGYSPLCNIPLCNIMLHIGSDLYTCLQIYV